MSIVVIILQRHLHLSRMSGSNVVEQEFTVRVPPREENKKYHVMKFRASLNQEFNKWTQSRMVRENNQKILQSNVPDNDDPKYGAGSVFGKDMKEELRLKKLGITRKKYDPDAQPWLMRINGKGGRKFKGIREGGVSENTSFYVFTHGKDGAFEAFPISDWYNFTPIQRYKTLDAEEAEERYANRGKILNKWAVMVNRKLKNDDEAGEEDPDGDEAKAKKGKKKGDNFKISDMDEWDNDEGDALDTSDEEKDKKDDSDSDGGKKKKSKDTKKKKKKNKTDVDEAFEDSDDGDDEGREVDYMSDESSESEEELEKEHDVKGIDQDEGIAKMLDSDESSDEDKKKSDDEDDEEEESSKNKKNRGESGDEDEDKKGKKKKSGSAANSRSATPTTEVDKQERDQKRKAMVANLLDPNAAGSGESAAKKSRLEQFGSSSSSSSSAAASSSVFGDITEDAVRRYLRRRPMTTTDLLKKFKSKKSGGKNSNELVQHLANILKKINPHKQKSQGTVYLSLRD